MPNAASVILSLACLLWVVACAAADQIPSPVVRLDLDEADPSGAAQVTHGQFGPAPVQGVSGGGLWFSGQADECVAVAHRAPFDLTDQLTIAAWIWPSQFGGFQTILWKGDRTGQIDRINYRLSLRPEGRLEFTFKGPVDEWYQIAVAEPLAAGRWTRVAAVFNRGVARLYVDGRLAAQGRMEVYAPPGVKLSGWQGDRMLTNDSPLEVGRGQEPDGEPGQCFRGAIDDVCLWSTALANLPPAPARSAGSPLDSLVLFEKEFAAAELDARPYLAGRVLGGPAPWFLEVDFPGAKDRGLRLPGKSAADGRFQFLLNDLGGPVDLLGSPRLRVRVCRRNMSDKLSVADVGLVSGPSAAKVLVDPRRQFQSIAPFGAYADVPKTFLTDAAQRQLQYAPLLAELREVGLGHLEFAVHAQTTEPKNDDPDPQHIDWASFRKNFATDERLQTLVAYLRYIESQGFSVGLRAQTYAGWQWIKRPGAKPEPDADEVAENSVALLKLVLDAGVHVTHFVPIWEPSYAPETVAQICAKTARLARRHGIAIPIVGPYRMATGGQSTNMDSMPDRFMTARRYVEPYLKIAGDVCDVVGVEDYASGCAMIEPNLKRLWSEIIEPLSKPGRPKDLWMLEYGAPCGVGPWNFYPSRWHGTYAGYDSAFRLARALHQQFAGGVSRFFFWKAYDVVGDGNLISCCGLVKCARHDYERRPPYYTARMFWKYIPPGARRIDCTADADLVASAFALNGRFTVVLTNPRPNPVQATLRLSGVELAPVALHYASTEQIKLQEQEVSARGQCIAIHLPPRSVSTVVCRAAHVGQPFTATVWDDARPGLAYLSDLPWSSVSRSGKLGSTNDAIDGQNVTVGRDANLAGDWIVIAGTRYRKGIGAGVPSEVVYDLDRRYAALQALVGLDDATPKSKTPPAAIFRVFLDGKKAYESPALAVGQKAHPLSVSCRGARQLRLVVEPAAPGNSSLRAAWAEARVTAAP